MSVLGYAVVCTEENSFTWWGDSKAHPDDNDDYPDPRILTFVEAKSGFESAKRYNPDKKYQFKLVEIREVKA